MIQKGSQCRLPARNAPGNLRVELDAGRIRGISVGGEKLPGAIGLHLRQDHTDTWTFDTDRFDEPISATLSGAGWVVEEEGPLRDRARLEARLGESSIRWTLDLHRSDLPPVVFDHPQWGNSPPRSLWLASEQRAVEDGRIPHF